MTDRTDKVEKMIMKIASQFIENESNKSSLVTVSRVNITSDLKEAKIFISVLPETKENEVIEFLKRNLGELRNYFKEKTIIKTLPFFSIEIDQALKLERKIDDAMRTTN